MEKLVENLKEIGFNTYEAKVYLALLKKFPLTGYEVSQLADIPQSRAYDTLKALEKENVVVSDTSKPMKYTPIKPAEIIKRYKRKTSNTIEFLDKNLPKIKGDCVEPILCITGSDNVKNKVIDIIKDAKRVLYIQIWEREYRLFEKYIKDAYHRGVDIKLVSCDKFDSKYGSIINPTENLDNSIDGRRMVLCADGQEGIMGNLDYNNMAKMNVIWTKNQAMVKFMKDFIVYYMYLIDIEENMSEQLKLTYTKKLKALKTRQWE